MSKVTDDSPLDPFFGDPADPAAALADLEDSDGIGAPLTPSEREDVLADIEDLDVFQALLAQGLRGSSSVDCGESHFFGWELMRSNLRHLLEVGRTRVHEPAYNPDICSTSHGVRAGFADGAFASARGRLRSLTPLPDRFRLCAAVYGLLCSRGGCCSCAGPGPATGTGRSRFPPATSTAARTR